MSCFGHVRAYLFFGYVKLFQRGNHSLLALLGTSWDSQGVESRAHENRAQRTGCNAGDKKRMKINKNNKKQSKANATAQAVTFSADIRNSHALRVGAANLGADLFCAHAEKRASKAYVATCAEYVKSAKAFGKGNAWLIVGGVANRVELRDAGFYVRSHDGKTVAGNVDALRALYGARVVVLSDSELSKLGEGKEVGRYVIGSRGAKRELSGWVAAESSDCFALAVKQDNGSLALVNGEWGSNAYNATHRASKLKG